MEETEESSGNKKCTTKTKTFRGRTNTHKHHYHQYQYQYHYHYQHQLLQYSNQYGFFNHNQYPGCYPALLPLPPPIPLQLALTPPLPQNHSFISKTQLQKPLCKLNNPSPPPPSPSPHTSSDTKSPAVTTSPAFEGLQQQKNRPLKGDGGRKVMSATTQSLVVARRPDSGGVEGSVITLLANHFPVQFDSSQRIFHYNVEISPNPSREVARMIKQKLVTENSAVLSGALPAYDGRKSLYSPVEFQKDRLEFYVSLPIPTSKSSLPFGEFNFLQEKHQQLKLFRINIKLVSKLDGKELSRYLSKEGDDWIPLPQDYLHALDVVLRESPMERCIPVGRSLYSSSMGGTKEIGGGAVALRGFFQSLRPTQQGLALNVDFSVTAFHESIGIIPYLQKRLEFLRDLPQRKKRSLVGEERKEVEKALKNIRIFVCHRETVQRYRVFGLTEEATENLWFSDRDGKNLRLLSYFKGFSRASDGASPFSSDTASHPELSSSPQFAAPASLDGPADIARSSNIPQNSGSGHDGAGRDHRPHHNHDPEHPSQHHHPDHLMAPHTKEEREEALTLAYMRAIAPRPVPDPKLYTPNLAVKCGPLLRYTGLRRGDAPAHSSSGGRETWRGSVMIVTTDNASDYSPPPHLRLFYVNPETGKGGKDARGSSRMHGMLGQAKEIQGVRLHAQFEVTFWRFNLEVDLTDSESKIAYQINRGPVIYFWVPAKGQTMNIMFHSCNGFSLSVNPDDFCGPDPMWQDVLNKHKERPFHVMLGGGDQIYNDAVTKQTVHFREWINIKTPFQKSAHEFTGEMSQELEEFYLERYSMWFAQGMFGVANAQIPMVNIWDDHDIIDGFGSYPNHFNRCPVFTGLGAVAFKYYMLFQHQSTVREKEEHEPSWLLGSAPGPYITELSRSTFMFLGRSVAFLGLDCRTERMRDLVLSGSTYEKVFARLRKEIVPGETKHLIVLLGIPIAYPRLVWLENLLTSRIMDPIKALGRMGIIGGFLNNFDGGVELLDDLDDHWTAKNHKQERNFFIKRLQQFAADTSIRITILGGDVHLAGIGQFFSNPKLKIPKDKDHRYMPNVISSAIVNTPPPNTMADILNKRNKIHHLDDNTDEDMYPIFLTDVDGTPRNNKRLLPRRNYCIIRIYDPARPIDGFEEKQAKQSTFSKIKKTMSKKKTDDMPPALPEHPLEAGLDGAAGSTMELDPHEYMRDGLQITLQMEINQHDPAGRTKPYSFNVPSLRKD